MLWVPPNSTESLGVLILKSHGIFPEARWYWIGVAALIGYIFLFNLLLTLALQYLDPFGDLRQYYPKKEWLKEKLAQLESSLSYCQEERALLKLLKVKEAYCYLKEGEELMKLMGKGSVEWFFFFNCIPLLSMRSDMQ
ncbi:PREDICTED: ABC transporter G family member 36-like [Prunus mume]|uniref:ABC transporter G family member 36-like n=1 Tax=Prunus mume TaxID=102107 RepID=A0ABM0PVI0_PRUMU|nr:PREDICTED: ABC transporter G family member 36-like [Prunus mume]